MLSTGFARIVLCIGAVCSAALCFYAGRHNASLFLRLLFVLWVLFPFVSTLLANRFSTNWERGTRTTLHVMSLLVTVASLAVYSSVAFGHPGARMGLIFLVIPPASGLLIAIVSLLASLV